MAHEMSEAEKAQLAFSRSVTATSTTRRERWAQALASALWLGSGIALWLVFPIHHIRPLAVAATFLVMVLANLVRFETPFGFTVASQIAFVPLLVLAPPAAIPLLTAGALLAADLPDLARGRLHPARLPYLLRNTLYAMGPAWVVAIGDGDRLAHGLVLLFALVAQFLLDFVVSSLMALSLRETRMREQLDESWVYLVDGALSGVGFAVGLQSLRDPFMVLTIVPLLGLLAVFARERTARLGNLLELSETYRGTALLLGDLVEADDDYTGKHSQGVVDLALRLGEQVGIDAAARRNLEFSALLHDIGKIAIPKEIINKPGALTPEEFAIVKTHPAEGEKMVARVGGFMVQVSRIVRAHHERWDGGGYPDGLVAESAPLEARIITCCDSWSAMRTDRPYRNAMSHEAAVAEMRRGCGSQFDPQLVTALLSIVEPEPEPEPEPGPEPQPEPEPAMSPQAPAVVVTASDAAPLAAGA